MAGKRTYEIEILAKIAQATASVDKFAAETDKKLSKITTASAVTAIAGGFVLAKELGSRIANAFSGAIDEALKAEEAVRQLNNAMRVSGEFSDFASKRMLDYADSLAKTTTFSDDQVVSSLALAKSFGLTNSEARKLVEAATELASFTGQDLNSAVQTLSATYSGHVRALQKQFPELKKFTEEQLAAGAAVDFFAKKLDGSAKNALNSSAGQIAQAKKEIEDFEKAVGKVALRVELSFIRLGKNIASAFVGAADAIKTATLNAQALDETSLFNRVRAVNQKINKLNDEDAAEAKKKKDAERDRRIEQAAVIAKAELEKFKSGFIDLKKQLELDSLSESARINKEFQNKEDQVRRGFSVGLIKSKEEEQRLILGLEENRLKKLSELQNKIRAEGEAAEAKLDRSRREFIENASTQPIQQLVNVVFGASVDSKGAIAIGAGITNAILKGADGARQAISSVVGSIADTIIPGIGGVVGEIVNVLGQGPEKVREMIRGFARAIPEIIKNIAESLPVLIEELVRELPPALAKAMPTVAIGFTTALIKNIPAIVKGFAEGLIQAAKDFVTAIFDAITGAAGDIGNGLTGGGESDSVFAGIPVLQGIGDLFGFADGGRTPKNPRLNGDRGIARIGPNEQVFNSDLTDRMEAYLDANEGGGRPITVVSQIVMDRRILAEEIYQINKAGFRT